MGEEQEQMLVRQCLQGDALAWETMVNAFGGQISRQVRRYGRLREETEDLTQEVFLKVYLNLRSFRANYGKLSHWLRRVGRNLIIDHLRRSRCFANYGGMEQLQALNQRGEQTSTPEMSAALNETGRLVREGLQALSPELQQVLRMKYLKGMSYQEISQQLGVPDGTVKSRLYRGRAKLADHLGKQRRSGRVIPFSRGLTIKPAPVVSGSGSDRGSC